MDAGEKQLRCRDFLSLPEELVDQILSCLVLNEKKDAFSHESRQQLSTLHAMSGVFHQMHRIVEPYLYAVAPITLNKLSANDKISQCGPFISESALSTTAGCNALRFIRTLEDRLEIRTNVQHLQLARFDKGFWERVHLGFHG